MANLDPKVEENHNSKEGEQQSQGQADAGEGYASHKDDSSEAISSLLSSFTASVKSSPPVPVDKKDDNNTTPQSQKSSETAINKLLSTLGSFFVILAGQTWLFVTVILLLTVYYLRNSNILPFFSGSSKSSANVNLPPNEFARNYVLVARYLEKLYFFDQQSFIISEISLDQTKGQSKAISRGVAGKFKSIDKISPSPDEKKVAIISASDKYFKGIFLLNFDSINNPESFITNWTLNLPPDYAISPQSAICWAPDSSALAFVASKENQPDLFIVTTENQIQRVTYHGKNIGTISWLDNQRLAFVSNWEGADQLYTINRNGGDLKVLAR